MVSLALPLVQGSNAPYSEGVPQPEGVDCTLHAVRAYDGIQLHEVDMPCDTDNGLSVIGTVEPGDWIRYTTFDAANSYGFAQGSKVGYKWIAPGTTSAVISAEFNDPNGAMGDLGGVVLTMRRERPSVDELDIHGYPHGTGSSDPKQIEWFSYQTEKLDTGNTVSWKQYVAYVVPVDFTIELSIDPLDFSKDDSWGAFKSFELWFKLETNVWNSAYTSTQMEDIVNNEYDVTPSASDYRGAFPIWAWVGYYNPWNLNNGVDAVNGRNKDPDTAWSFNELPPGISAFLNTDPKFAGSEIQLYKSASRLSGVGFYSGNANNGAAQNQTLISQLTNGLDGEDTYYFPIMLAKYGAYAEFTGWPWDRKSNYYFPVTIFRVRVLYAVWGEWIYLWTKEAAEEEGYVWENRTSRVIHSGGWWEDLSTWLGDVWGGAVSWFGSPINLFLLFFGGLIIAAVIIGILNPGLYSALAKTKQATSS